MSVLAALPLLDRDSAVSGASSAPTDLGEVGLGGWKGLPRRTQQPLNRHAVRVDHLFFIEKGEELL